MTKNATIIARLALRQILWSQSTEMRQRAVHIGLDVLNAGCMLDGDEVRRRCREGRARPVAEVKLADIACIARNKLATDQMKHVGHHALIGARDRTQRNSDARQN